MTDPTNDQRREMIEVLNKTHAFIDSMQIAGLEEKVIVPAIHTALVERYLRAGGVSKTVEWLQRQADMTAQIGNLLLAEIELIGR